MRLLNYTGWQLKLLARYQILWIALIIGLLYAGLLMMVPVMKNEYVVIILLFSDPVMLGFIFIGVMILFEKSSNTLPAVVTTPMKLQQFMWPKALALLVPTFICTFLMVFPLRDEMYRWPLSILSVILTSLIFSFLGIGGAVRVKTFNQYIIVIPLFMLPMSLPLLYFFKISHSWLFYLIPTQSTLFLMQQAYSRSTLLPELLAILYLGFWVYVSYRFALSSFRKVMYS